MTNFKKDIFSAVAAAAAGIRTWASLMKVPLEMVTKIDCVFCIATKSMKFMLSNDFFHLGIFLS